MLYCLHRRNHKRIGVSETGKNTGGMGSFAPAEKAVNDEIMKELRRESLNLY